MAKYWIKPRFADYLKAEMDGDTRLGALSGPNASLLASVRKKLGRTDEPELEPDEYSFLRSYIEGLVTEW